MTPIFRTACADDADKAEPLLDLAIGVGGPSPRAIFQAALAAKDLCLLLQINDKMIALGLARAAADELEIHSIAVARSHRRQGLGMAMVRALETHNSKLRVCFLEVRIGNTAARTMYRRCGYLETGTRPRYYRDGEDAITMRHVLKPC